MAGKKKVEEDVVIEVDMTPQALDHCLRNGLMEAQVIYRVTPKGCKALLDGMKKSDKKAGKKK